MGPKAGYPGKGEEQMVKRKVSWRLEEKIAFVEIDNPPMNVLAEDVRDQFEEIFDDLYLNKDEIGAVILTGAGEKAFAAGADINGCLSPFQIGVIDGQRRRIGGAS